MFSKSHIRNIDANRTLKDILTTKLKTGNIKDQKIKDIWKDKKYQIIRDGIENKKPVGVCGKCSVIKPNYYILPT